MGKLAELWKKLKSIKHVELIACGAAVAIVLSVYFSCTSCGSGVDNAVSATNGNISAATDYCSVMQSRVEDIVSQISGVGSCKVVINWDRTPAATAMGGSENPKPVGALIVCSGGSSTKVKLDVIYAVSTLLDLSIEKIMVYPKSH